MTYQLPTLPYPLDALEPFIDARIMDLHYNHHHATYVRTLNDALQGRNTLMKLSLEELVVDIRKVPEDIRQDVRNNGGGHLNHSLFWHIMSPGQKGQPEGPLMDSIMGTFGSYKVFRDEFTRIAMERFGSGWAWLCMDTRGKLEVVSTANQDSPIMMACRPILGLDLWEHAYYLQYQDRRDEYIANWWKVVNWQRVGELYAHCVDWVARVR